MYIVPLPVTPAGYGDTAAWQQLRRVRHVPLIATTPVYSARVPRLLQLPQGSRYAYQSRPWAPLDTLSTSLLQMLRAWAVLWTKSRCRRMVISAKRAIGPSAAVQCNGWDYKASVSCQSKAFPTRYGLRLLLHLRVSRRVLTSSASLPSQCSQGLILMWSTKCTRPP